RSTHQPDAPARRFSRVSSLARRASRDRRPSCFRVGSARKPVNPQRTTSTMPSCVLAYSGGLDTSVILGWLQDQGYQVHAVYVDLGQPCEDRQAILQKAKDCGAKSSRIVDAQEELC